MIEVINSMMSNQTDEMVKFLMTGDDRNNLMDKVSSLESLLEQFNTPEHQS